MEPLDPGLREALKEAHPGLTDRDIDRVETLLALRAQYDPETDADEIRRLDEERAELINRLMPHYIEIARAFRAKRRRPERDADGRVNVKIKRPET